MIFPSDLFARAETLIERARVAGAMITTAESCTGGLVSALLTEVPGASNVVDRTFVTYSNEAKAEMLGIPLRIISASGAVSAEVARRMADGGSLRSNCDVAVSITGVAGPGGTPHKPAGLVYFGLAVRGCETRTIVQRFGDRGRSHVRLASVETALNLLSKGVDLVR
jgi:nicotinamide-nucleotide amidase